MIYLIIGHIILLFTFFITLKAKKRENYIKFFTFYYKILKSIDILLVSLFLFSIKDLSDFFPVIPKKNVSINLTLYTIILTGITNYLEGILITNKKVSIEASLSPKKMGDTFIKENIQLPSEDGEWVKAYIVLVIKGHVESLLDSEISITLPKTATAQLDNYTTKENIFKFPLKDYISKDGLTSIEITLVKESIPVISETNLEVKLITKSLIKELFMIKMNSEKCGLKEK